ncbi:MAG: SIS domain-containing protein [Candidatus Riflebacteria bacterium]|nr:SIS domain-containing protein [Candidatus Riflebacteria bacterium]
MCGVIGLRYQNETKTLGNTACQLLKMLEYRGYDSTGAIIQTDSSETTLLKDVGAPSKITYKLGINKLSGHTFCGQVRWATFGAVTKENAQPHEVRCKIHVYGAHNGNVTNCTQLKEWLQSEGHKVLSDNDGEMVVHMVEHYFAENLSKCSETTNESRITALRNAAVTATSKICGSFAAIIVDPVTRFMLAIKSGSSLYIGKGHDAEGGDFIIASSDLGSVLSLTKILIPIKENEFAAFDHNNFDLYDLKTGRKNKHEMQRSLLRLEETKLQPQFKYFMEQEIFSQVESTRRVIDLFTGRNSRIQFLKKSVKSSSELFSEIKNEIISMTKLTENNELKTRLINFNNSSALSSLNSLVETFHDDQKSEVFSSHYSTFLKDLSEMGLKENTPALANSLAWVDSIFELETVCDIELRVKKFVSIISRAVKTGKTIYFIACGSSFHAAKTASLMFNDVASVPVFALLPGEFRAQCTKSLKAGDVIIGISQSGETKDLIDIFNIVASENKNVHRICILNNMNSTLALEKTELAIPLICGPEIAVPATKSFINQLLVLYLLAVNLDRNMSRSTTRFKQNLEDISRIPGLIESTLKANKIEIEEIAEHVHLKPSVHILATRVIGIAKEGALKIREIVLNHTEGFESSEFKHGPNTILGLNTIFGVDSMRLLLGKFGNALVSLLSERDSDIISGTSLAKIFQSASEWAFNDTPPHGLDEKETSLFKKLFSENNFFESVYQNYPLIFVTGPGERDVNLTISQINTHKIRGADVFLIAEDNHFLREAVSVNPGNGKAYNYGYITLPRTDHELLPVFSITVALQLLAFSMSRKKMELLNRIEIEDHGVHPDAPKNVSKSITVD